MVEENTVEEEATTEEEQVDDQEDLKIQIRNLENQVAYLAQNKEQKKQDVSEDEMPESVAQALAKDPQALARWIQAKTKEGVNEVRKETQKQSWDRRAEEQFPSLKTDQKFKNEVSRKIQELIGNGEYSRDSPQLVFRASELASIGFKNPVDSGKKKSQPTSLEHGKSDRQEKKTGFQASDDDPRLVFALMNGVRGEKLKDFKKHLEKYGPYEAPKVKKSRMILGDE